MSEVLVRILTDAVERLQLGLYGNDVCCEEGKRYRVSIEPGHISLKVESFVPGFIKECEEEIG